MNLLRSLSVIDRNTRQNRFTVEFPALNPEPWYVVCDMRTSTSM